MANGDILPRERAALTECLYTKCALGGAISRIYFSMHGISIINLMRDTAALGHLGIWVSGHQLGAAVGMRY